MLFKHLSFLIAILALSFVAVTAIPRPVPSGSFAKRAPAPVPSLRFAKREPAPAPAPVPSLRLSKRDPAPAPVPSLRLAKREPAPASPSARFEARAPVPSRFAKRDAEPEPMGAATLLACQELNTASDRSTAEFLSTFNVMLTEMERKMWVGLECESVITVDRNLAKRGALNLVSCLNVAEGGMIATGCTPI